MSLQNFFDNFALIFDPARDLTSLRELILQAGIQGHLNTQDPNDDSGSVLMTRIAKLKASRQNEGKINYSDQLPISEREKFFVIPSNWTWARLGEIGQVVSGGTPRSDNSSYFSTNGIAWLTPADLYKLKGKYVSKGRRDLSEVGLRNSSAQLMPAGSVVFSSRAPIGYVAIASNSLSTNQGFKSCVPYDPEMSEFIYWFLKSVAKKLDTSSPGTTFREISGKSFSQVAIPIPPIDEQKRIVARIDKLMRLCDELEERHEANRKDRVRLNDAVLSPLNKASSLSRDKLEQATTRLFDNFHTLYDSIDTVAKLRSTILQLAVQGKLVRQPDTHDSAVTLLRDVQREKERQRSARKSNQLELLPQISANDVLVIPTPKGWSWAWLGDLARFVDYRGKTPAKTMSGVKLITAKNVRMGFINEQPLEFIAEETYSRVMTRGFPKYGDILFTTEAPLGNVAQLLTHERVALAQRVIDLQVFEPLCAEYLKLCLMSPLIQRAILERATGMTASGIKASKLKLLPIPIPPLEEQKLIVAEVNRLKWLCNELETKLREAEADSEKLMNAAIQSVLRALTDARQEITTEISVLI